LESSEQSLPRGGRTVVLLLGGVTWREWAALSQVSNTSMPGLRRILEEGALGAVRLPGAPRSVSSATVVLGTWGKYSPRPSSALLRAATILSTGSRRLPPLPSVSALTLGVDETLNVTMPGYEDAPAAVAYARRTGTPPRSGSLLNLGWGALQRSGPAVSSQDRVQAYAFGALGDSVRQAGGGTAAIGSADTGIGEEAVLLREWALLAADGHGAIDTGDVSGELLERDVNAPFGLRTNTRAMLAAFDATVQDKRPMLIAVEWGDTRRANLYAPLCAPAIAATHRRQALLRADAWLRALIDPETNRLTDSGDRLFVVAVPDLTTSAAQWLPTVVWRPERGGQGALLQIPKFGEVAGVVSMESLAATVVSRFPPGDVLSETVRWAPLRETGTPVSAARRIGRLLAFQSGMAWLDAVHPAAHGMWAALLSLATLLSLVVLVRNADNDGARKFENGVPNRPRWTRTPWRVAMTVPLLLWLAGFCLEVPWRMGPLPQLTGDNSGALPSLSGQSLGALLIVAFVMFMLLSIARGWFGRTRLFRVRVGVTWFVLAVLGLLLGGFALPWNTLFSISPLAFTDGAPTRLGDLGALLLISATLLGVSGLTRAVPKKLRDYETIESETQPYELGNVPRRVINLRPAGLWMIVVVLLLLWDSLGRNGNATLVAAIGFGTMWMRLWLERHEREVRLTWRRRVMIGVAFLAVLLLQRGGAPVMESALADWWPRWLASWQFWWWDVALISSAVGAALFLSGARPILRDYLRTEYSSRAMLTGATFAAFAALILFGPSGPPLLGLYTLGAVIVESTAASR